MIQRIKRERRNARGFGRDGERRDWIIFLFTGEPRSRDYRSNRGYRLLPNADARVFDICLPLLGVLLYLVPSSLLFTQSIHNIHITSFIASALPQHYHT